MKGKYRNFAAYSVGWLSVIAWWIVTYVFLVGDLGRLLTLPHRCSGLSLAAVTLAGLVQLWQPQFAGAQWQIYLIYVAVAALTCKSPSHAELLYC